MLELAILGFLKEGELHGYELKQRLARLTGYYRRVSDGALYPAIARLEKQGYLTRRSAAGAGAAPRQVLALTPAGETALLDWLRTPAEADVSDRNRFFTLMAFLRYLEPDEQRAVLTRRLAFLEEGRSFFEKDGKPVKLAQETDEYRRGMLRVAREMTRIEKDWLSEELARLIGESNHER